MRINMQLIFVCILLFFVLLKVSFSQTSSPLINFLSKLYGIDLSDIYGYSEESTQVITNETPEETIHRIDLLNPPTRTASISLLYAINKKEIYEGDLFNLYLKFRVKEDVLSKILTGDIDISNLSCTFLVYNPFTIADKSDLVINYSKLPKSFEFLRRISMIAPIDRLSLQSEKTYKLIIFCSYEVIERFDVPIIISNSIFPQTKLKEDFGFNVKYGTGDIIMKIHQFKPSLPLTKYYIYISKQLFSCEECPISLELIFENTGRGDFLGSIDVNITIDIDSLDYIYFFEKDKKTDFKEIEVIKQKYFYNYETNRYDRYTVVPVSLNFIINRKKILEEEEGTFVGIFHFSVGYRYFFLYQIPVVVKKRPTDISKSVGEEETQILNNMNDQIVTSENLGLLIDSDNVEETLTEIENKSLSSTNDADAYLRMEYDLYILNYKVINITTAGGQSRKYTFISSAILVPKILYHLIDKDYRGITPDETSCNNYFDNVFKNFDKVLKDNNRYLLCKYIDSTKIESNLDKEINKRNLEDIYSYLYSRRAVFKYCLKNLIYSIISEMKSRAMDVNQTSIVTILDKILRKYPNYKPSDYFGSCKLVTNDFNDLRKEIGAITDVDIKNRLYDLTDKLECIIYQYVTFPTTTKACYLFATNWAIPVTDVIKLGALVSDLGLRIGTLSLYINDIPNIISQKYLTVPGNLKDIDKLFILSNYQLPFIYDILLKLALASVTHPLFSNLRPQVFSLLDRVKEMCPNIATGLVMREYSLNYFILTSLDVYLSNLITMNPLFGRIYGMSFSNSSFCSEFNSLNASLKEEIKKACGYNPSNSTPCEDPENVNNPLFWICGSVAKFLIEVKEDINKNPNIWYVSKILGEPTENLPVKIRIVLVNITENGYINEITDQQVIKDFFSDKPPTTMVLIATSSISAIKSALTGLSINLGYTFENLGAKYYAFRENLMKSIDTFASKINEYNAIFDSIYIVTKYYTKIALSPEYSMLFKLQTQENLGGSLLFTLLMCNTIDSLLKIEETS